MQLRRTRSYTHGTQGVHVSLHDVFAVKRVSSVRSQGGRSLRFVWPLLDVRCLLESRKLDKIPKNLFFPLLLPSRVRPSVFFRSKERIDVALQTPYEKKKKKNFFFEIFSMFSVFEIPIISISGLLVYTPPFLNRSLAPPSGWIGLIFWAYIYFDADIIFRTTRGR